MGKYTKRRSYGRKSRLKRRRSVKQRRIRRIKRRSGIYTKRTRFPAKNPFGDKAYVKLRFNRASYISGDGASSQTTTTYRTINNLADTWLSFESVSKGFLTYPKLFRRYKVNGVMVKFTVYQLKNSTGSGEFPSLAWILPYSTLDGTPTVFAQNAIALKSQRHTAWANVANWGNGGRSTTVKKFFKMKSLVGANYPSTDIDYSGTTDVLANPYNAPAIEWRFLAGISSVAEVALPTTQSYHYNLEMTYYVEFWEQTWEAQGL
ncbi:hypothetical protein [Circovirus-like genome RW-A]|uniref:hypothetical protein n=1 Tax=Circovirus-like genome RW-A TaxID=642251 RepID=UPI0001AE5DB2|nr:hypothetical protein [Circovirus-like genome RW-A]ACQ78156.1 hypothetical protein [Circovirus-like genome RW-A]